MIRFLILLAALALGLGGCNLVAVTGLSPEAQALILIGFVVLVVVEKAGWLTLIALLLIACAPSAQAAEPIDLPLLRDVICDYEMRDVPDYKRDLYDPGPHGEIGRCRIRIETLRRVPYSYKGHWLELLDADENKEWALRIISELHRRRRSVFAIAFAYNGGPRAEISKGHGSWAYAQAVTQEYQRRKLEQTRKGG